MIKKLGFVIIMFFSYACSKTESFSPSIFIGTWKDHFLGTHKKKNGTIDTITEFTFTSKFYKSGDYEMIRNELNDTVYCLWYYNEVNNSLVKYEKGSLNLFAKDSLSSQTKDII